MTGATGDNLRARSIVRLTTRQLECVALAAQGYENRAIAARLGIGRHAVKYHLGIAYKVLGLTWAGDPRTLAAVRLFREIQRLSGQVRAA